MLKFSCIGWHPHAREACPVFPGKLETRRCRASEGVSTSAEKLPVGFRGRRTFGGSVDGGVFGEYGIDSLTNATRSACPRQARRIRYQGNTPGIISAWLAPTLLGAGVTARCSMGAAAQERKRYLVAAQPVVLLQFEVGAVGVPVFNDASENATKVALLHERPEFARFAVAMGITRFDVFRLYQHDRGPDLYLHEFAKAG